MFRTAIPLVVLTCLGLFDAGPLHAGPINPPAGPVAPTPGPEPRTPISLTTTPGDADSLFRIAAPGSYYLTGNITGMAGRRGIEIDASGVTIDLNGFELIGPGSGAAFDGVGMTFPHRNISVVNGSIRNWTGDGIDTGTLNGVGGRIVGVHSSGNGQAGIRAGDGYSITNCTAVHNTGDGIATRVGCTVTDCAAKSNGGNGFIVNNSCTVVNCAAANNILSGIRTGSGCTVAHCAATANSGHGIEPGGANLVQACSASLNLLDGIRCIGTCTVQSTTCSGNGAGVSEGAGIHITGSDNRVDGNNCTGNDRGVDVDAAGNIIVNNTCAGNTTDWDITADNVVGPILDRRAPASAVINGFSAPGSLGSTEPNANFSY
ncbi:MAG: right-handed parallel beta-helix repeat-containing protein [Phycisphaerales bacterium]